MMLRRRTASLAPFLSNLNRSTTSSPSFSRIVISPRLSSSAFASFSTEQAAGVGNSAGTRKKRSLGRQLCQVGLISLAGGFFLSGINDIAIFHGCSRTQTFFLLINVVALCRWTSYRTVVEIFHLAIKVSGKIVPISSPKGLSYAQLKAIEKASQNQQIVESLGLPIVRGPWYDASFAVGYRRQSVSSTFPVSGPHGTGIFELKALRRGGSSDEDTTFSFLKHRDWDILILEALLHVPSNNEKQQTIRVSVTGDCSSIDATSECIQCKLPESPATPEK
ncbi:hypothetical protein ZIOFF_059693 [Zingiber officinale]|uniref:Uncharacterized protein n=1 Tax=Zingiber officinale TaxID=94328 RepID=A0A8J5FBK8_ZINOF|nr:hypothetical protein ZIOFF_059693 [Zingiber officinale]